MVLMQRNLTIKFESLQHFQPVTPSFIFIRLINVSEKAPGRSYVFSNIERAFSLSLSVCLSGSLSQSLDDGQKWTMEESLMTAAADSIIFVCSDDARWVGSINEMYVYKKPKFGLGN